jgi:hypothetical protein
MKACLSFMMSSVIINVGLSSFANANTITIIGERIYNDGNTIYCDDGTDACANFLQQYNSFNEGLSITLPNEGGPIIVTPEMCAAKADKATSDCKDAVVAGGAWMGGTFCLAVGVVASFFTTPLGGAAAGTACAGAGAVGGHEAIKKCEAEGAKQKESC